MDTMEPRLEQPLCGHDLYKLPEFKALCERIGIAWGLPTNGLVIEIPEDLDALVKITQTYQARSNSKADAPVETTDYHNERFRTFKPRDGM